jgi:hypothetical protein
VRHLFTGAWTWYWPDQSWRLYFGHKQWVLGLYRVLWLSRTRFDVKTGSISMCTRDKARMAIPAWLGISPPLGRRWKPMGCRYHRRLCRHHSPNAILSSKVSKDYMGLNDAYRYHCRWSRRDWVGCILQYNGYSQGYSRHAHLEPRLACKEDPGLFRSNVLEHYRPKSDSSHTRWETPPVVDGN